MAVKKKTLTINFGMPVDNALNSMTAGTKGLPLNRSVNCTNPNLKG